VVKGQSDRSSELLLTEGIPMVLRKRVGDGQSELWPVMVKRGKTREGGIRLPVAKTTGEGGGVNADKRQAISRHEARGGWDTTDQSGWLLVRVGGVDNAMAANARARHSSPGRCWLGEAGNRPRRQCG
jgi:hypothetical protein